MQIALEDTIAALASAPGRAARAIIRVSGPGCRSAVETCFTPGDLPRWRQARRPLRHSGRLRIAEDIQLPADCLLWPTHRSYTGQPMAELQLIGSVPLTNAVLESLWNGSARPAKAGEFTLRAFLAGRIDLLQAEAVLGVIEASDDVQLKRSLKQLSGGISGRLANWRSTLMDLLADLEAGLDFVEDDIEFVTADETLMRLQAAADDLHRLADQAQRQLPAGEVPQVVLVGPPNAGKSTLLNALYGQSAALVSDQAGTTRDWVTADVSWQGVELRLIDTAGWDGRPTAMEQESEAARERVLETAAVVLECRSGDQWAAAVEIGNERADERDRLRVLTKLDLLDELPGQLDRCGDADAVSGRWHGCSAATGEGLERLRAVILERIGERSEGASELIGTTAARCRDALRTTAEALQRAHAAASGGWGDELVTLELREALDQLGLILGQVFTDDILDRVFSRFCIGK